MGGGDVSELGGNGEAGMMIFGRPCRDPPTTLTASWWAGYYRAKKGGARGEGAEGAG